MACLVGLRGDDRGMRIRAMVVGDGDDELRIA